MTAAHAPTRRSLNASQIAAFERDGYLVLHSLANQNQVEAMRRLTLDQLETRRQPIEYEADVSYPGAPASRAAHGGDTPRRLLQAYDRDAAFQAWAENAELTRAVCQLLDCEALHLTRSHHNCVMTKHPGHSSATLWHQDIRYWSYDEPNLVNAWLALGHETPDNGCMWLLPGTHHTAVTQDRLDAAKFLRPDLPENKALIDTARPAEIHPGDVLLFHSRVFHAAGRNQTDELKLSAVFTYHDARNQPLDGTRSSRYAGVPVV